ncbi:MAG: anti-sigma factor [Proteobacteria bacterium]|nr:anti-sigma factor [Pseudomonadota bacterium]
MTEYDRPVTEDELHAYVDGELPDDRREAVTAWLASHTDAAGIVAAWRTQADDIRARYGAVAHEPIPERLQLDRILAADRGARPGGRRFTAMAAAAVFAAFIAGGGAGWFAHGAAVKKPSAFDAITADALEAYRLYVVEVRHPVEVPGSEQAHLRQWLSKRVGYELSLPDLSSLGLKLVGGRLLPGPSGAAAFYMYEGPSGERYTIYCAKAAQPATALRFKSGARDAAFTWVDDKVGYVVSGPSDRDKLESVAKNVYDQVDKGAAKKG